MLFVILITDSSTLFSLMLLMPDFYEQYHFILMISYTPYEVQYHFILIISYTPYEVT